MNDLVLKHLAKKITSVRCFKNIHQMIEKSDNEQNVSPRKP